MEESTESPRPVLPITVLWRERVTWLQLNCREDGKGSLPVCPGSVEWALVNTYHHLRHALTFIGVAEVSLELELLHPASLMASSFTRLLRSDSH